MNRLLVFVFSLLPFFAKADLVSLIRADQCNTIIEYKVEREGVHVLLEIGFEDLSAFKEIIPSELGGELHNSKVKLAFDQYTSQHFTLIGNGKILQAIPIKAEVRKRIRRASLYTGDVDSTYSMSPNIWYVELFYPAENLKELIISGPQDQGVLRIANIGFVLYHQGLPVNDLRYLSEPITLTLNWEDPWYSEFNSLNFKRHHNKSLMSYLYVEPYQVRHEVLVRLKDLEEFIDLDFPSGTKLKIGELDSIEKKVESFILSQHGLVIDGEEIKPYKARSYFLEVSLAGTQILEDFQEIAYESAIIGVIYSFAHPSIPEEVDINWNYFSLDILEIPYVLTDPAGPMPGILMIPDTNIHWTNYLKNYELPTVVEISTENAQVSVFFILAILLLAVAFVLRKSKAPFYFSLFLAGVLLTGGFFYPVYEVSLPYEKRILSADEETEMVSEVLSNVYRSFSFRTEGEIYDGLATVVHGDLLSEIYLQVKNSIKLENQGGLEVKIEDLKIDTLSSIEATDNTLAFNCIWEVNGKIGHWGHVHQRTNRYEARLYFDVIDGNWKLGDIQIIDETRLL